MGKLFEMTAQRSAFALRVVVVGRGAARSRTGKSRRVPGSLRRPPAKVRRACRFLSGNRREGVAARVLITSSTAFFSIPSAAPSRSTNEPSAARPTPSAPTLEPRSMKRSQGKCVEHFVRQHDARKVGLRQALEPRDALAQRPPATRRCALAGARADRHSLREFRSAPGAHPWSAAMQGSSRPCERCPRPVPVSSRR